MNNKILIFLALGFFGLKTIKAQNGEELFKKNCSPCHTVGAGKLVGPDLQGITQKKDKEWLLKFTKSSTKLINSGDPDAVSIFNEFNRLPMPDQNLSDLEIDEIMKYIAGFSGNIVQNISGTEFIDSATKMNIDNGYLLFTGKKRLSNKGVSCVTCHNISDKKVLYGGKLARDLSLSYINLKAAGIKAILDNPPFPAMTACYKNTPITEKEKFDLTAYIKSVSSGKQNAKSGMAGSSFLMFGLLVFLVLNTILALFWNNGKTKSTNYEIIRRQKNTI